LEADLSRKTNLLLSASLIFAVAALSQETARAAARQTIVWKFHQGEKLYYQLDTIEQRDLRLRNGDKSTEVQRQTYWYCWSVQEADSRGARIRVTFNRIQAQLENPSGAISVDTAAPLGRSEMTRSAAELQAEVFRMARSSFVFHASPHGGVPRPLPNVPPAVHMPERFTTGQLPVFVERPMGNGGEWSLGTGDAEPGALRVGTAVYRITGSAKLDGASCLKLDSATNFDRFEDNGTIVESDPGTGRHYFRAESGRLLYSEQSNHFLVLSEQSGRSVTDSRLIYRLLTSPPRWPGITVERKLTDGETVKCEYRDGKPTPVEGEWARVISCGGTLEAWNRSGGQGAPQHQFQFLLRAKVDDLKSISIYDVTVQPPALVASTTAVPDSRKQIRLATEAQRLNDPALDWLRRDEVTECLFKIVLENHAGATETLYQPILQRSGAIRDHLIEDNLMW
jgi:hypothetical protein